MKQFKVKATIFFLVALLLVCAPLAQAQTSQKPIELNFAHFWPSASFQHQVWAEWAKRVEQGTNNRVKITIYPSNTLCPANEIWNGIKSGAVDIGGSFANYQRSGFEFNNGALNWWIGGPTSIEAGLKLQDDLHHKFPQLIKEFSEAKVLWLAAQGARLLLTTKPVRTVDDLKGMLLRPTSPMEARIFQELKISTPSFMPMSEVYTSLQKGIIQGTWVCPEVLASFRLGEVVKYITDVNFGIGVNKYVAMSWQKWNQLPPDIQKVFERESAWGKEEDIKAWNKAFDEGIKFAKSKGAEFIHFPPQELAKIMKVVNAVEDEEAKKLDAKGYPGTALLREMRKAFATGK